MSKVDARLISKPNPLFHGLSNGRYTRLDSWHSFGVPLGGDQLDPNGVELGHGCKGVLSRVALPPFSEVGVPLHFGSVD